MSPVNKRLRDRQWDAVRTHLRKRARFWQREMRDGEAKTWALHELAEVQRIMSQIKARTRQS